jgi:hypothetical protein
MTARDQPRFPLPSYLIWLAVIVAFAAVPYLLFAGSTWLGQLTGCVPDFKMGSDCHPVIQSVNTISFVSLALTMWVTLLGLPIWLIALVAGYLNWRSSIVFASDSEPEQ